MLDKLLLTLFGTIFTNIIIKKNNDIDLKFSEEVFCKLKTLNPSELQKITSKDEWTTCVVPLNVIHLTETRVLFIDLGFDTVQGIKRLKIENIEFCISEILQLKKLKYTNDGWKDKPTIIDDKVRLSICVIGKELIEEILKAYRTNEFKLKFDLIVETKSSVLNNSYELYLEKSNREDSEEFTSKIVKFTKQQKNIKSEMKKIKEKLL